MHIRKISLLAALLLGVSLLPVMTIQPAGATTFTVTRTGDPPPDGCRRNDCSLREAVIAANNRSGPDTIKLAPRRYELTRPAPDEDEAQTGDLDILKNVTITGAGPGKTIIDGNGNDRIFHLSELVDKGVISNLAVKGGSVLVDEAQEQGGGGLLNLGKLTLTNTLFENNQARGEAPGGGISNHGKLVVKNSRITGNRARGTGVGGGIDNPTGTLVLRNSRLDHNRADGSFGAGLYTQFSKISLFNSTIDHNRLPTGCCGGGVYAGESSSTFEAVDSSFNSNLVAGCCGSGLMVADAEVLVRRSVIKGNLVEGCCGGGVMAQSDADVVLRDTLLARNTSEGCCAGGLIIQSGSDATLVNSRVLNNKVAGCCAGGLMNQGGRLTLSGTLVKGNESANLGGGIVVQSSAIALVMNKSTVARNSAVGDGGGIHISSSPSVELTNSTISGNTAGAVGGGIWEDTTSAIALTHVTITKNEASGPGGGISTNGGTWTVLRSIIGGNTDDCNAPLTGPTGVNLDKDASCFAGPPAIHAAPRLKALADNGGKTPTHNPRRSSAAVDAVPRSACPPLDRDQRGVRRPQNGDGEPGNKCDVGAVERKP